MSFKLERTLSESGRTLVLRIPKDIQRALNLKAGEKVFIWVESGKIILEPIK